MAVAAQAAPTPTQTQTPGALFSVLDHLVVDGTVNTVLKANGSLYVGGTFTRIAPRRGFLQRLDPVSGAYLGNPPEVAGGSVKCIISDGASGWYIAGNFTHVGGVFQPGLAHLDDNGTVDTSFRPDIEKDGPNATGFGVVNSVILSGGYIYAGGNFYVNGGAAKFLARFDPGTGAWDPTFAPASNFQINDMVLTTAGRIIAAGLFTSIFGQTARQYVISFNPATGVMDAGFDVFVLNGTASTVSDIEYDPAAGVLYLSTTYSSSIHDFLYRVDATTGTVDDTYQVRTNNLIYHSALDGAGGLFLGGRFSTMDIPAFTVNRACRELTSTGKADPSFLPNPDNDVSWVQRDNTGKVFLTGLFANVNGLPLSKHTRVLANGSADPSWTTQLWDGTDFKYDGSGNLLMATGPAADGLAQAYLVKVDPVTGAVDTAFNPVITGNVTDIKSDGASLYVSGAFTTINGVLRRGLARLDQNTGAPITAFNAQMDNSCTTVCFDYGSLYAVGAFLNAGGLARQRFVKLDPVTGNGDAAFQCDASAAPAGVLSDGTGSLVVAGNFATLRGLAKPALGRVNAATGVVDTAFLQPVSYLNVFGLYPAEPGWAYVCAMQSPTNRIRRVHLQSGTLDNGFVAPLNLNAITVAYDGGSGLYVGGNFDNAQGVTTGALTRLNAFTGALDANFPPLTCTGQVNAIGLDPALSQIYVGGSLTGMGGKATNGYGVLKVDTPGPGPSPSNSASPSLTASPTRSATATATPSASPSSTPSPSGTRSPSQSPSPTRTLSLTFSPSPTGTPSYTGSPSASPSGSASSTPTATPTATLSASPSLTPSATPSSSQTPTPSITLTPTASSSITAGPSPTGSPSPTPSPTDSLTPSVTPTPSLTGTPSSSPSATGSPSGTGTGTSTMTDSPTSTATLSATPSVSPTLSPTGTGTASVSPTFSASPTGTNGPSPSSTSTASVSATLSSSPTPSPSGSSTLSSSPTITVTDSPTATPPTTFTPTVTLTSMSSASPSATATQTSLPAAPTLSSTVGIDPGGELKVLASRPVPNPVGAGPVKLAILLEGGAEWVEVSVFSPGYTLIAHSRVSGPFHAGWVSATIDGEGMPTGLLFYVVRCGRGGKVSLAQVGKLYRLP